MKITINAFSNKNDLLVNNIDLCLFDIDYTLINGEGAKRYYSLYSQLIEKIISKKLGINPKKTKTLVDNARNINGGRGELILEKYNLQWVWYDEILKLNPSFFIKPNPAVINLLNKLKKLNIKLVAITDAPIDQVSKVFKAAEISLEYFENIVGWEKGKDKPKNGKSKIFSETTRQLKFAPQRAVMIGDSLKVDVLPACNVGLNAVYFSNKTVNKSVPYYTIRNLQQLLTLKLKN